MSSRPWYKRYGADFVFGTMTLSLEEKGAYSLCLDLIYDRGAPIPDDARWLAGVCGVSVRKWGALRQALIAAGKIVARDGHLTNERAEDEIEKASETSRKLAENGSKGGNKSTETRATTKENSGLAEAGLEPTRGFQKPEEIISEAKASSTIVQKSASRTAAPPEFEAVWATYPHFKGRSSKPKAIAEWRKLDADTRGALLPAVQRYRAEGKEPRSDCGAKAFELWLKDARYIDWMTAGAQAIAADPWTGPAEFRDAAIASAGEDFVRSYLDPSGWRNGPHRHVLAKTGTAADRLTRELRGLLAQHGMTVRHERAS